MNPYLHGRLVILWCLAICAKCICAYVVFPQVRLPRFLVPYVTTNAVWSAGLFVLLLHHPEGGLTYKWLYWAGEFTTLGLAGAMTIDALFRHPPLGHSPWATTGIVAAALASLAIYCHTSELSGLALADQGAGLWVLGLLLLAWVAEGEAV